MQTFQATVRSDSRAGLRKAAHAGGVGVYARHGKRWLDIVLVLAVAPLALFLVAVIGFLILLDGGQPFFSQQRVGRGGRCFRMWKLRTMERNADSLLLAHLSQSQAARAEWSSTQKLRSDPRVTGLGRWLRKSSLDELPQLWNVLLGDMSLVGPRPMLPAQRALYPGQAYYALRPGLTGPWQVSSRNGCAFAERAVFDAAYGQALSFRTDMRLMLATVRVVLRGTGH